MTKEEKDIQDLRAMYDALLSRYDQVVAVNRLLIKQLDDLDRQLVEAQTKLAATKLFINTKYEGEME